MEIKVLNKEGKATAKKVSLTKEIFAIEPNDHAIYLDVNNIWQTKDKVLINLEKEEILQEVQEKLKSKKEQVLLEQDLLKTLYLEEVVVFSVQDQESYSFKLNKKLKVLARKSALTYKAKEDSILVLDDLSFKTPKTKDFISVLKNLKIDGENLFSLQ